MRAVNTGAMSLSPALCAWKRWSLAGSPVWMLEPETFEALSRTEVLSAGFSPLPPLPHRAFYLELGALKLEEAGIRVEGVAVTSEIDGIRLMLAGESTSDPDSRGPGLTCDFEDLAEATEETDVVDQFILAKRDHFLIRSGDDVEALLKEVDGSVADAALVTTLNLILALARTTWLERKVVQPKIPKSPKKRARARRRGQSFLPYTYVYLDEAVSSREVTRVVEASDRAPQRAHVCRGHWRRYWVSKPGERDVPDAVRPGRHGELHRVLRWVRPHKRGVGEVAPKTYVVKKRGG